MQHIPQKVSKNIHNKMKSGQNKNTSRHNTKFENNGIKILKREWISLNLLVLHKTFRDWTSLIWSNSMWNKIKMNCTYTNYSRWHILTNGRTIHRFNHILKPQSSGMWVGVHKIQTINMEQKQMTHFSNLAIQFNGLQNPLTKRLKICT